MRREIRFMPMIVVLVLAWIASPMAMAFVEEFDYADPNDFEAVWGEPVLGGTPATTFDYTTAGSKITALYLDDPSDSDGQFGTASFSQAVSWSGDFVFTADVSWIFLDTAVSNGNGHVYIEVRDAAGIIGSCGMMDDWIGVGVGGEIAAWGQVGGPQSLYANDTHGGASNPVTNGTGAIATSWFAWNTPWGAVLYVPEWDHRWYEDGQTKLAVYRHGDVISIYMTRGGEIMELVSAQGSDADVAEIRIKYSLGNYDAAGYPNPTRDLNSLAVDRLELTTDPITLTETDGSTDVTEGNGPDTYSIVLNEQPPADVNILVSADPNDPFHVTLNGGSPEAPVMLTFTPTNWATPQNVTVEAVDDFILEAEHSCTIHHDVIYSGAASVFEVGVIPDVVVSITDNEALTWQGEAIIDDFDYTDENDVDFINNWGAPPTLGGYSAQSFDYAVEDSHLIALQLVDSTVYDPEHGLAAATFTKTLSESFSGDFRIDTDISWAFVNGQSDGRVFIEAWGATGILASFGMFDDWIAADSREIAAYAQIGGTASLSADNRTQGGADPRTTVGAIATSLISSGGWVPAGNHRFYADGNAHFRVERTGSTYRIYLIKPEVTILLVQANGGLSDIDEIRIKYQQGNYSDIGYVNADSNVDNLAIEYFSLRRRVVSVVESNGGTSVAEANGPDSYQLFLDRQPSSAVTITATPADANVALNGAAAGEAVTLTFEVETWDQPQSVAVAGVDDTELEFDHSCVISHSASSEDPLFDEGFGPDVQVSISDNDCGLWGYLLLDLNQDCYVNLLDFAAFTESWLKCTLPGEVGCENLLQP